MNTDDTSTLEAPPDPGNPTLDAMMSGIDAIGDETPAPAPQPASTAPAPAPDPAPAPVATPAPASTPSGDDDFGLSKLTPKPAAKPAPEPAKPAPAKPTSTKQDPAKSADPAKPAEPAKPDQAKGGIKELREQYELTKAEREQLAAKVAELERTREEGTRKQVEEATKALKEEIESIRKEREEAEREIQFLDYTKSRDYNEKYQKPLTEAWTEALQDIDGIKITDGDGSERPADERDILALTKLPAGAAAVEAHERFGPSASVMLQHRANIVKLSKASQDAVKRFREEGARIQEERAKIAQENESKVVQAFDGSISALEESHPTLFGKPTEAEDVDLFEQGHRLVEVAFKGKGLENLPPDQRQAVMVKAKANVAARARSYGPQRALNMRLERQVAELQEKLAKLTASEPGQGSKPVPSSEPGRDDLGRFSGMSASEQMVAGIDSL